MVSVNMYVLKDSLIHCVAVVIEGKDSEFR